MPKVIFTFDKEKDLHNIWETCNFKSNWSNNFKRGLPSKVLELCEDKRFQECEKELKDYFLKIHKSELIVIFIKSVQEAWNKINDEFFKRLKKIMKKPICSDKFIGYLTTAGRCPYDFQEYSFMFSLFYPLPNAILTTAHEIMHVQFHNTYWKKIEKQIGKEKTADLKEALTVLLNIEFQDLWFAEDQGYEPHKELRKFIEKEWKKEKDFDVLMKKCTRWIQKNM